MQTPWLRLVIICCWHPSAAEKPPPTSQSCGSRRCRLVQPETVMARQEVGREKGTALLNITEQIDRARRKTRILNPPQRLQSIGQATSHPSVISEFIPAKSTEDMSNSILMVPMNTLFKAETQRLQHCHYQCLD